MVLEVKGFSKLTKSEKIDWIISHHFKNNENARAVIKNYWNTDEKLQQLHEEFAENTISNFYLPFSIAPNFLINDKPYTIPMVIEESSVVAAASKAAKFWAKRGGFKAKVEGKKKIGQVHFKFDGPEQTLRNFFSQYKSDLIASTDQITKNMKKRGGGILEVELVHKPEVFENFYQLHCGFNTADAMGANFINSCLEQMADYLERESLENKLFIEKGYKLEIIISILSNYVPECTVTASVSCDLKALPETEGLTSYQYAEKFIEAIRIAEKDSYRAVTHNKGIMNGIDAVVIATGNDFRAIEAGAHSYASANGKYKSLSSAWIEEDQFHFALTLPLALGTVGGLTNLHPLVKIALQLLGNPSAEELMKIIASAGLAQNFAAVNSLITTGIQRGHMKMHLMNILNQFNASSIEKEKMISYFEKNTVSYSAVKEQLEKIRN